MCVGPAAPRREYKHGFHTLKTCLKVLSAQWTQREGSPTSLRISIEEYRKVKSSLKAGKAGGPDGISPDVLKSCDFGDVCLKFCNKALLEKEHTVALSVLLQSCTIVSYRTESVKYTT